MYHLKLLIACLASLKIGTSLPIKSTDEIIKPVELSYDCIFVPLKDESERKSPVLLIHGLGGSRRVWTHLSLLLATRTKRRICAVDLRNHGDSPWNNRSDVEALAVDIGHFLDTHGMKKINIIGQSLGGKTGIHFALKNPDRVNSLITEDMSPNFMPKEALQLITSMFQLLKAGLESIPEGKSLEEAREYFIKFLNEKLKQMGSSDVIPDQLAEFIEIKLVDGKWRFKFNVAILEQGMKDLSSVWTPSTGKYEGPALFIYGTRSPFKVYEAKENIIELFPKVQFLPVEGAGHLIHGLFREFDDAVIKFLDKLN